MAWTKYFLLGLAVATLFIYRADFLLRSEASQTVASYADSTAVVAGTVADDPDVRDTSTRVTLSVSAINGAPASGKLLASLSKGYAVSYGDTLTLRGLLELPQNFITNTGREFDYQNYLRVRGVGAVMQHANVRAQTPGGFSLNGALFNIKHAFERSLEQVMQEPEVSLLEGILLGERGGLSGELLQLFVIAGLIHVVVLSGSNIAVLSEGHLEFLAHFCRGAPRTCAALPPSYFLRSWSAAVRPRCAR